MRDLRTIQDWFIRYQLNPVMRALHRVYQPVLRWALLHRLATLSAQKVARKTN